MSPHAPITVDVADFERRIIEPDQFVADTKAFVDVRIERSRGKASYSFIGPGVSQNAEQTINLPIPHGFNLGAASMPHGVVNNPHLHYTAEVFVCTRGQFRMTVGRNSEQSLEINPGDVFAAPPWVFRGFENTGPDDSWVFVVLGGDDTGGIIWSPDVLREAAETGLYLGADSSLIDSSADVAPTNTVAPASDADLGALDEYTDAELEAHAVRADARAWSAQALLSSVLDGYATELAPALGFGMTEDRHHRPPIATAQGFSVEWLRIAPGNRTGLHRLAEPQALLLTEGDWRIAVNDGDDSLLSTPTQGSVASIPPHAWRDFENIGTSPAVAAVICGTDSPNRIAWSADILAAAAARGFVRDAAGKVAPRSLVSRTQDPLPGREQ